MAFAPWSVAHAAVSVSDSSLAWTPMVGEYDSLADQQTGDPASDIVGSGVNYGMFATFNDNGSASRTDGSLGFRLRLDDHGGNNSNISFSRNAWIGIDANLDGALDVFLGLNLQGSAAQFGVFSPGSGTNTSPKTTSVNSTATKSYALTSANYNYRPVNYLSDGGSSNDVTTGSTGDPDYYVSFMVPFADVVAFLAGKSISINDGSPLRYVSATSTQSNSLNQDLGGVNGGTNSSSSWEDLGGFTQVISAAGNSIPEPGISLIVTISLGAACLRRPRRLK